MVSSCLYDPDVIETISKVKSNLISSCGDYLSSELSFHKVCTNRYVQFILPYIILILIIMLLKPEWSVNKYTNDYNYCKIFAICFIVYISILSVLYSINTCYYKYF